MDNENNDPVQKALHGWVRHDTSNSPNPPDEIRFYKYIASVWCEEKSLWDERKAHQQIVEECKKCHDGWGDPKIKRLADKYLKRGTRILDFLSGAKAEGFLEDLCS